MKINFHHARGLCFVSVFPLLLIIFCGWPNKVVSCEKSLIPTEVVLLSSLSLIYNSFLHQLGVQECSMRQEKLPCAKSVKMKIVEFAPLEKLGLNLAAIHKKDPAQFTLYHRCLFYYLQLFCSANFIDFRISLMLLTGNE